MKKLSKLIILGVEDVFERGCYPDSLFRRRHQAGGENLVMCPLPA